MDSGKSYELRSEKKNYYQGNKACMHPCVRYISLNVKLNTVEPLYNGQSLGTEESGCWKEVAFVERFQTRCMNFLSTGTKKSGVCREVAVSRGSTVHITEWRL